MTDLVQPPPPKPPLRVFLREKGLPILKRIGGFLKMSPIGALLIYTFLSLELKENYPFSHYPMYSNPSDERHYYLITDGSGQPIPIQTLTGVTCPKIGKIFRKKAEELAKKHDVKAKDLSPEGVQEVCDEMFAQLRQEAEGRQQTLPDRLQLKKSFISYQDSKVVENVELIGTETPTQNAR